MSVRRPLVAALSLGLLLALSLPAPAYNRALLKGKDAETGLVGSEWHGQDGSLGLITIRLQPRGVLVYIYRDGSKLEGLWRLQNNQLYFSVNNSYRETEGAVQDRRFHGRSWNRAGSRWETTLQRQK